MRAARLTTVALAGLLVAPSRPARSADAPRPVVRPSAWFTNPAAPSQFFTNPPRSTFFSNPPPPSRFFTDPPRYVPFGTLRRPGADPTVYDGLIHAIAARYGVEFALVKAMIRAESDFDHRAVSPKGACGLMQLMPATASSQGVRDVFHPAENIDGGCRYLRELLDRYSGNLPLALAAYNAGPERVDAAGGVPRIAETREYLSRVLQYRLAYRLGGQ